MIKLINYQSKFESDTQNTFVDLLAWISQIISNRLPPIFFNMSWFGDRRAATPLCFGARTGLSDGLTGLHGGLTRTGGSLIDLGGDQTGWCGSQTVTLCIEQNFLTSEHQSHV
jgi:hypothetical protein